MDRLFLFGGALAVLTASPAYAADFMFNFDSTTQIFGGPVSGSGVITTSDTPMQIGGQTAFEVTNITGMVNGSPITGQYLTFPFGNYFTTGPTFVDGSGIRFSTAAVSNISLFYDSNSNSYRVNAIGAGISSLVDASSSPVTSSGAVPEISTWAMMILGFGAIAFVLRRRRRGKSEETVRLRFAF